MIRGPAILRRLGALLLTSAAALYAVPLYLMVTLSVKTDMEAAFKPFALPSTLHLENYATAWRASASSSNGSLAPALVYSLVIAVLSVAGLVISGGLAGYVLARRRSRLAGIVFGLFLVGMAVPQQLGLVPLFQLVRGVGLVGNPLALVIVNLGLLAPLTVFLYTSFIRGLPSEYDEAALIDGASHLRIFWHVVLPLVRPVTATVIVIHGVHVWNDFFTPLIFLLGSGTETLPVAIFSLVGEYSTNWGPIFAGVVIASAPALLVFVFLQRHIVQGFSGGIK